MGENPVRLISLADLIERGEVAATTIDGITHYVRIGESLPETATAHVDPELVRRLREERSHIKEKHRDGYRDALLRWAEERAGAEAPGVWTSEQRRAFAGMDDPTRL
jgi:hypothetical protein